MDKMEREKIGGQDSAANVIKNFGTADVFSIAERSGIKIVYEYWFPVTWGEFDKMRKTIYVNLRAGESRRRIIAHELGHFFARDLHLTEDEEERFAHEFAAYLTAEKG